MGSCTSKFMKRSSFSEEDCKKLYRTILKSLQDQYEFDTPFKNLQDSILEKTLNETMESQMEIVDQENDALHRFLIMKCMKTLLKPCISSKNIIPRDCYDDPWICYDIEKKFIKPKM